MTLKARVFGIFLTFIFNKISADSARKEIKVFCLNQSLSTEEEFNYRELADDLGVNGSFLSFLLETGESPPDLSITVVFAVLKKTQRGVRKLLLLTENTERNNKVSIK